MGATRFIATHSGKEDDFKPYARSLDLIVATTNDESMPLTGYLSLLRPGGHLILVGAPEKPLPAIPAFPLILSNVHIAGSAIGSPKLIQEMLELAAKQNVKSWIEKRDIKCVLALFTFLFGVAGRAERSRHRRRRRARTDLPLDALELTPLFPSPLPSSSLAGTPTRPSRT